MKLDILALAAHPDDTELACAGTLAKHISLGYKVGVVDFTRGEMGTRGTPEIRDQEARASAEILGLEIRENLKFDDVFFQNNKEHQLKLVKAIRKFRLEVVFANTVADRHPDHPKAARLAEDSCFIAGLTKVELADEKGNELEAWRPKALYHYVQSQYQKPDFVVDITGFWDIKMKAIMAFKSQFYDPDSTEPETYISSPEFMKMLESRAKEYGHSIGTEYGEGFNVNRNIGVKDVFDLL